MREFVLLVLLVVLIGIAFNLGGRWKVMKIADGLRSDGVVTARWGETKAVKITGTVEDLTL